MSPTTRPSARLALAGGLLAALAGAAMLAARLLGLDRALPGFYVMKANTALAFLLCGGALTMGAIGAADTSPTVRRLMQACGALAATMGAFDLLQRVVGLHFGIDALILRAAVETAALRRMTPATAVNFVLAGSALAWEASARRDPRPAHLLAAAALLGPSFALIGYAFEAAPTFALPSDTRMAAHTALAFWALCGGILFLRPDRGVMAVVTSDSAGGVLARRLLPAIVVLPVAIGWLRIAGERTGLYGDTHGVSLLVFLNVTLATALVAWTAVSLHRTDAARRRAQEALAASEHRYRQLTEASIDAIAVVDAQGRLVDFNPAAERAFGYQAEEVLAQPFTILMPPAFRAGPDELGFQQFLETHETHLLGRTVEVTGRRKDGSEFPVELSLAVVELADGVQFIGSMRDLTERHRMRSAMVQTEKLASIGLLSAGVAHEINNPLAYVANNLAVLSRDTHSLVSVLDTYEAAHERFAEADPTSAARVRTLRDEIDLPYVRANLDRILGSTREGVERVTRIVQTMRGMARTGPPRMETVNLPDLIDMSLELIRGRIARRGIAVELDCDAAPTVRCAASQLGQVVLNLVVNAVQAVEGAGRSQGGRIRIGSRTVGGDVLIEVQDNGCGIAPADLEQIFDPFFTTKDVGEGTGLGLAISHGIVTAHGGRIEASSSPGEGSCFRIFLPQSQSGGAA